MEETPQGSNNAGNVVGWIERIVQIVKKYGIQQIFMSFLILFIAIVIGIAAFNPNSIWKAVEKAQSKAHTEAVVKRIKAEPQIREALMNFKGEVRADRTFILEAHNGGSNLTNLPFLYVDLTYSEPKNSLTWLEQEYRNVRLSHYPLASFIFDNNFWFGSIDELKEIDEELALRLQKEDVMYFGMMMMYGKYNPSGTIGVVYINDYSHMPSITVIRKAMLKYSSAISPLLNNENW